MDAHSRSMARRAARRKGNASASSRGLFSTFATQTKAVEREGWARADGDSAGRTVEACLDSGQPQRAVAVLKQFQVWSLFF